MRVLRRFFFILLYAVVNIFGLQQVVDSTPMAPATALPMAAGVGAKPGSPNPFAPYGPSGSGH